MLKVPRICNTDSWGDKCGADLKRSELERKRALAPARLHLHQLWLWAEFRFSHVFNGGEITTLEGCCENRGNRHARFSVVSCTCRRLIRRQLPSEQGFCCKYKGIQKVHGKGTEGEVQGAGVQPRINRPVAQIGVRGFDSQMQLLTPLLANTNPGRQQVMAQLNWVPAMHVGDLD